MGNYKEWINTIDIEIDYYSAFIKSWIAFNSWYRDAYGNTLSDSSVIEKIKTETNTFKTAITKLLEADDNAGIAFRENIGKLHVSLCSSTITSQERTKGCVPVSFNSIAIANPNNKAFGIKVYYDEISIERTKLKIHTQIKKSTTGVMVFDFIQEKYDIYELTINPQFNALRDDLQRKCTDAYNSVNPYLIESVLTTGATKFIECSGVMFVHDIEKISRALIDILYLLRCSLMHGDVAPNQVNMQPYYFAYNLLAEVLKNCYELDCVISSEKLAH